MSTEEPPQEAATQPEDDATMQDASSAPPTAEPTGRKRPRLDLAALKGGGERKRGRNMFGVLVNTLNKAKAEDKERNASEAAKKRQLIEQRLQNKLKKETDSVRQAEEAKKDKLSANRKEEDLQLKDSIYKLRRTRLPQLANFLSTSDIIPREAEEDSTDPFKLSSLLPPRSHPPPLYYLPSILTPEQEAFLSKRKVQAKEAAEKEWEDFRTERATGIEEISSLRRKVADQESKEKPQSNGKGPSKEEDVDGEAGENIRVDAEESRASEIAGAEMDVDDGVKEERTKDPERKDDRVGGDDEDAVEY